MQLGSRECGPGSAVFAVYVVHIREYGSHVTHDCCLVTFRSLITPVIVCFPRSLYRIQLLLAIHYKIWRKAEPMHPNASALIGHAFPSR